MGASSIEGFEFVSHTADIAIRLRALRLDRLFDLAAAALVETITDRAAVRPVMSETVTVDAADLDQLLVEWLHELLYLFETRGFLPADTTSAVEAGEPCRLRATVRGERRDPERHGIKVLVKAVTYHGLQIARTDQGYEVTVILDV